MHRAQIAFGNYKYSCSVASDQRNLARELTTKSTTRKLGGATGKSAVKDLSPVARYSALGCIQ